MAIIDSDDLEIALLEEETGTLSSLLKDIWIEDERRSDIHDLNRAEMADAIMEWVEAGVQAGSWTIESWHKDVLVNKS